MTAEMSRRLETVNHLQVSCYTYTLLQAVAPQVLGNCIILPQNTLSTTEKTATLQIILLYI